MVIQQYLDNFSSELTKILIQEIESGNEIVETSNGWPNQNTIIVVGTHGTIAEVILP